MQSYGFFRILREYLFYVMLDTNLPIYNFFFFFFGLWILFYFIFSLIFIFLK